MIPQQVLYRYSGRMIECKATNSKSSLWQFASFFREKGILNNCIRACFDSENAGMCSVYCLGEQARCTTAPWTEIWIVSAWNVSFRFESLYAVVYDMIPCDFLWISLIWSSGALSKGLSRKQNLRLSGRINAFFARCIELVQIPIWRKIQEICVLYDQYDDENNDHSKR